MLILNGFAVDEETAVVVEVKRVVPVWCGLRSGWAGPQWHVGPSG